MNQRQKPVSGEAEDVAHATDEALERISRGLLDWYATHQRKLPWRSKPTPYAVWVSETMLQQTQVATVVPYFRRWMKRFPSLGALSRAQEDEVLACWQGLGYYSRARNLLAGSRQVQQEHAGRLPADVATLRTLPGVGAYTAGAIASIAFGQDTPAVDGNVVRVLTRLFAISGNPARPPVATALWSVAARLIPKGQGRHFNQALMELGALVCTPKRPRCADCPVQVQCIAFSLGAPDRFPEKPRKPPPTPLFHTAILIKRGRRVLLRQNAPDADRWASMWLFPMVEHPREELPTQAAQRCFQELGGAAEAGIKAIRHELKHSVTRFRIHLTWVELCPSSVRGLVASPDLRWATVHELPTFAMPSAHRRLCELL